MHARVGDVGHVTCVMMLRVYGCVHMRILMLGFVPQDATFNTDAQADCSVQDACKVRLYCWHAAVHSDVV